MRAPGPATMTPFPSCPDAAAVNAWTWPRICFSLSIWVDESPVSAKLRTAFPTLRVLALVVILVVILAFPFLVLGCLCHQAINDGMKPKFRSCWDHAGAPTRSHAEIKRTGTAGAVPVHLLSGAGGRTRQRFRSCFLMARRELPSEACRFTGSKMRMPGTALCSRVMLMFASPVLQARCHGNAEWIYSAAMAA